MESLEPKKLALLRILQIFQKHSDHDHPLRQEEIARLLESEYGIGIERKAVGRNVSLLKEAGFEIESGREGSYLDEREFTDAELRVLIDGVLSSRHITARHSRDLIDKLCALSNRYFRSHMQYVHSVGDWEKTENQALFYNIEIVDEAIERGIQIRFDYNKYGTDKKLHRTRAHTVSPYQMILHNQRYYLMARSESWKNVSFFRLDRITNMTITEEKLVPITELEGYKEGINYRELSTAFPYMFTDRPERVEFLAEESVLDQVIDWFGKEIRIAGDSGKRLRISVIVSPGAMEHWAMQYAGYVTVTSPRFLVDRIRNRLKDSAKQYENGI